MSSPRASHASSAAPRARARPRSERSPTSPRSPRRRSCAREMHLRPAEAVERDLPLPAARRSPHRQHLRLDGRRRRRSAPRACPPPPPPTRPRARGRTAASRRRKRTRRERLHAAFAHHLAGAAADVADHAVADVVGAAAAAGVDAAAHAVGGAAAWRAWLERLVGRRAAVPDGDARRPPPRAQPGRRGVHRLRGDRPVVLELGEHRHLRAREELARREPRVAVVGRAELSPSGPR